MIPIQINGQNMYSEMEPTGWSDNLSISVGYDWAKGSTNTKDLYYNFSYMASFKNEWDLDCRIEGGYGKSEGEEIRQDHLMEILTDRWIFGSYLAINHLGNIETNRYMNLYTRTTTGLGVRVRPLNREWIHFSMLSLPIADHSRSFDFVESKLEARWENRAVLTIHFSEIQDRSLTLGASYIPNIKAFDDYRQNYFAETNFRIIGNLNLTTTFKRKYTSKLFGTEGDVSEGARKVNYSLTSALSFEF